MSTRHTLIAIVTLSALLAFTGCAPESTSSSTTSSAAAASQPAPSAAPSSSAAPDEDIALAPAAFVLTKTELQLHSTDGTVLQAVPFDDAPTILSVLIDALGDVPAATPMPAYPIVTYEWDGLNLSITSDTYASIAFTAATAGTLALETAGGVQVGMTRDEALAAGATAGPDLAEDGVADYLMLDPSTNPDATSLEQPGKPGTDFIGLFFRLPDGSGVGDVITQISAPANDYSDL